MLQHSISKIKFAIGGLVGSFVLLAAPMAFASINTGLIETLRINTNTQGNNPDSGSPRVSVILTGNQATSCPNKGFPGYAYNNANTGIGRLRTDGLLAAYKSNQQVIIVGTGNCDEFGVETINFIDLK